jgi:hypothetical protein
MYSLAFTQRYLFIVAWFPQAVGKDPEVYDFTWAIQLFRVMSGTFPFSNSIK